MNCDYNIVILSRKLGGTLKTFSYFSYFLFFYYVKVREILQSILTVLNLMNHTCTHQIMARTRSTLMNCTKLRKVKLQVAVIMRNINKYNYLMVCCSECIGCSFREVYFFIEILQAKNIYIVIVINRRYGCIVIMFKLRKLFLIGLY